MKPKFINIGSAERPVIIPDHALKPETDKGREWWENVANGTVVLEQDTLDKLLSMEQNEKD